MAGKYSIVICLTATTELHELPDVAKIAAWIAAHVDPAGSKFKVEVTAVLEEPDALLRTA